MAVYNKDVAIKLNSNPTNGQEVTIGDGAITYFTFTFVTARTKATEVTIGSDITTTVRSLYDAFFTDYNLTGIYDTEYTSDTFTFGQEEFAYTPQAMVNTAGATVTISAKDIQFAVNSITFATCATLPCENIKVTVVLNEAAVSITAPDVVPVETLPSATLTFLVVDRGINSGIIVENASGDTASQAFTTPSLLNEGLITISLHEVPAGTSNVYITHATGLDLEYSLDNVTWQSTNVYTGITAGSYTLYVRDDYGCNITKAFTVTASTYNLDVDAYLHISKANSLRFAQRISYDCSNMKTDENSLSCETDKAVKYKEIQLLQTCDVITTQFKSSYSTHTISVDTGSVVGNVTATKLTENLRQSQKLDAKTVEVSTGVTGVYFTTGNIYDYDTDVDTGEDHYLNGQLPEWGVVGGFINVSGTIYAITTISFNEAKQAYQIELPATLSGSLIVGSVWNRLPYEVYEFEIDMATYDEIEVEIEATDSEFTTVTYQSELIKVDDDKETIYIEYYNDVNTDIYIGNDIKHKLRLQVEYINGLTDNEVESYKTDDSVDVSDVENYELDEFRFRPMTKEMMRKVVQALSHQNVYINGVRYVKQELSSEPNNKANIYHLTAVMIKSASGVTLGYMDEAQMFEIPALLEGDTGFIAYE